MLDHDKAHRILLSRRKWHRTDCDCSECADHEVLSAYIERCKTLEAEITVLRGLLAEMQALFPGGHSYRGLKARVRAALASDGRA